MPVVHRFLFASIVTTLRSLGRGGLVVAGHSWLAERFGRLEFIGIVLLLAGDIPTVGGVASSSASRPPLSDVVEVLILAGAATAGRRRCSVHYHRSVHEGYWRTVSSLTA